MQFDSIIIGGGMSGLSAAVDLASRGKKILLLEQRQYLGGRTHSFTDRVTGDVVDNGQHLMMGCYKETRRYLRIIGSEHLVTMQPNLHIDFLDPVKGASSLVCRSLPSPLHVLAGLFGLFSLSFADRLRLLRVGVALRWTSKEKEHSLEAITVDEWLTSLGQSEQNKNHLWNTIAIGSLNDHPTRVSALLFFRVLRAAFMGTREDSCLLIPNVGLSSLLVDPAVQYLSRHGGEVRTGIRVHTLSFKNSRVSSISTSDGETFNANSYIQAVPYYDLQLMFPDESVVGNLHGFTSTPILSINLWFDRQVFEKEFAAVLNSKIQWIFNRSLICRTLRKRERNLQHLSLVISGADEYVDFDKESIVQIALNDLLVVLPKVKDAKLVHSLVIKEKRATFSPRPGVEALRPSTTTKIENLFLAGDWTNTGYPATIEGAIISGRKAAEATLCI